MIIFKNNEKETRVERIEASVKWYNPEKGYGFLMRDNHPADIMIHFSNLAKVGCPYVKEGDRVVCEIAQRKFGLQVVRVIEVKFSSSEPRILADVCGLHLTPCDPESLEDIEGVIKWYNPDKGYGFILPNDGSREIFVPSSVMRRAGYKSLQPGSRVLAKVSTSERGPEARIITVLLEEDEEQKQEALL